MHFMGRLEMRRVGSSSFLESFECFFLEHSLHIYPAVFCSWKRAWEMSVGMKREREGATNG